MKKLVVSCVLVLAMSSMVSAEIVQGINIDFVTIGNPGNPGDTRAEANPYDCGAVGYEYQIGKYEVTNGQWDAFVLAAGAPNGRPSNAYDESTSWTGTDIPTTKVSWYEAAQFCNYLTSGDKNLGAYQFNGDNTNPGDFLGIDRDSAISTYGITYVIPSEDEWYKAAYYSDNGYSTYANGTDVAPIKGVDTNYNNAIGLPWDINTGTMEQNSTFDMMGNIWEWNETWVGGLARGIRGGSYADDSIALPSTARYFDFANPYYEGYSVGFRIASVPEPCTLLFLGIGGMTLLRRKGS